MSRSGDTAGIFNFERQTIAEAVVICGFFRWYAVNYKETIYNVSRFNQQQKSLELRKGHYGASDEAKCREDGK